METNQERDPLIANGSSTYGAVSDDPPPNAVTDDTPANAVVDGSPARRRTSSSSSSSSLSGSQDSSASGRSADKPGQAKAKKVHRAVFFVQVLCLASMAGSGALYLDNHYHRWGQCLMTAYYMPGGILTYSELTIFCDVVAHVTMAGCFLILSMMTVNWFAGIRASLKCIKIELGLTIGALTVTTVGCGSLIWNLKVWCDNLATSVQCQKGDTSCPSLILPMSCHNIAKEFDAKNYSKYDNMFENYESMTNQTALLVLSCIIWCVLTALMSVLCVWANRDGGTAGLYRLSSTKYTRPVQPINQEHTFPYNDFQSASQESQ